VSTAEQVEQVPAPGANGLSDENSAEQSNEDSLFGFSMRSSRTQTSVNEGETTTAPRNAKFKSPKCERTPPRHLCLTPADLLTRRLLRHAAALRHAWSRPQRMFDSGSNDGCSCWPDEYISCACLTRRQSAELKEWQHYTDNFPDRLEMRESRHTAPYSEEVVARQGG